MQRVIYLRRSLAGGDQRGLQRRLERVFQYQFEQPAPVIVISRERSSWRPAADVYDTENDQIVQVELPGMRDATIDVVLEARVLRISGSRPEFRPQRPQCYDQMGLNFGAFELEVFLTRPFDAERVTAYYDDGFLFVLLPKPS
jgi:HSP20 family protein